MINKLESDMNSNKWKLDMLCQWLQENGINDFVKNIIDETGLKIDLYLPTQNIAVHLSDGYNQTFYMKARESYKVFFIRHVDSMDFVLLKMRNCLDGHTCKTAPKHREDIFTAVVNDAVGQIKKRKRVRITAQRVITKTKL